MQTATICFEGVCLPLAHFDLRLDLAIYGKVVAVFGRSGSGKTSLLDLVAGLRRPLAGRVHMGGRLLNDGSTGLRLPPEQRRVGYVPQEGALFPHLSVRENLFYGHKRLYNGNTHHKGIPSETITDILDIRPLLDRPSIHGLSGGERQRIALARALLSGPELLLLDEPLASLDAGLKERVLPYLQRVHNEFGVPMLLVTHSPAEVIALCDEAIILEHGRVVQQGHPAELFVRSEEPVWVRRAESQSLPA